MTHRDSALGGVLPLGTVLSIRATLVRKAKHLRTIRQLEQPPLPFRRFAAPNAGGVTRRVTPQLEELAGFYSHMSALQNDLSGDE